MNATMDSTEDTDNNDDTHTEDGLTNVAGLDDRATTIAGLMENAIIQQNMAQANAYMKAFHAYMMISSFYPEDERVFEMRDWLLEAGAQEESDECVQAYGIIFGMMFD